MSLLWSLILGEANCSINILLLRSLFVELLFGFYKYSVPLGIVEQKNAPAEQNIYRN